MSLAENLFIAAKELLLTSEHIKRLDDKVSGLAKDVSSMDHRLVRIEALVEFGQSTRRRSLPGGER